jgi:hypothetical protein
MKKLILATSVLATSIFASASFAQNLPILYAPNYTCAELQQIVGQAGGEVGIQMRFGYAVYASHRQFCHDPYAIGRGVVFGTRDAGSCNVGVVCTTNDNGGGNGGS